MKHHLVRVILLFLLAVPILHADMKQKKIVVSSFTTEAKAQNALDKLEEHFYRYPDTVVLLQENNIELTSRPSGNYHIVVIEPFSDKEALAKVKEVLSKRYNGFFVNNYTLPTITETVSYANHTIEVKTPKKPKIEAEVKTQNEPKIETDIEEINIEEVITEKPAIEESVVETPIAEVLATNATIVQESVAKTLTTEEPLVKEPLSVTTIEPIPEPTPEPAPIQKPSEEIIEDTKLAVKGNNTAENSFISHTPSQEAESHDSFLPPWWVLLSVLVLIFSPISSYIENRNKRHYY